LDSLAKTIKNAPQNKHSIQKIANGRVIISFIFHCYCCNGKSLCENHNDLIKKHNDTELSPLCQFTGKTEINSTDTH